MISAIARLTSNARLISSMYKSHKILAIITIIVKIMVVIIEAILITLGPFYSYNYN